MEDIPTTSLQKYLYCHTYTIKTWNTFTKHLGICDLPKQVKSETPKS